MPPADGKRRRRAIRVYPLDFGIFPANTKASTTAYDPTCGSGSLLLKVAAEAGKHITLEGQEKDVTTAGQYFKSLLKAWVAGESRI